MSYNSSRNMQLDRCESVEPYVGVGATELCWTDRHAFTVIQIVSPDKIVVQQDSARRTDSNGMSECQSYVFDRNFMGKKVELSKRKNGRWIPVGEKMTDNGFLIGVREEYYDFSF